MGRYRLFLSEATSGQCGMSTSYSYDGNSTLTVEWKGNVKQYTFRSPCAVYVETGRGICGRDFPLVKPLSAPHGRANAVLWLCGIAKEKRCSSHDEYLKLCEAHRAENFTHEMEYNRDIPAWDRTAEQLYQLEKANTNQLYESEGPGWAIARSTRPDYGGYYNVAAWVDDSISADTAISIADMFGNGAPEWYIAMIIRKPEEGERWQKPTGT